VIVNSIDDLGEEWEKEIEIFLCQLEESKVEVQPIVEAPTPTLEELVRNEVKKLVESGMLEPTHVVQKNKSNVKKSKKHVPKAKEKTVTRGKIKVKKFDEHPICEKVLCVAQEAILVEKLMRSKVESKMTYPP
jgi:hypothetical protein